MDRPTNNLDSKRELQVKILTSIGVIIGVYALFTYVIPFARFQLQRIRTKRDILRRLETENTDSTVSSGEATPKHPENSSTDEKGDGEEAKRVVPPNFRISKDKFVAKAASASTVTPTPSSSGSSSTSTGAASKPSLSTPSRLTGSASNAEYIAPRSGFLPQFSNLPDIPPTVVTPISLQQQRFDESRRRLIEQQNQEYEQSLAKEREQQRVLEEQQRAAAAKEALRQQIIQSVPPEPDSSCAAEDCLVFAFRAKQLSLKAEDLNKPFKSTRGFLKSHTWDDVIHYVQSLELRPLEAPFAITANATVKSFKIESEGEGHDTSLRQQALSVSGIPSNTVLWIHYH